jgi:hypothetical protein
MITQEKWRDENEEVRGHIIFFCASLPVHEQEGMQGNFFRF